MSDSKEFDLVVIGAGPGGYVGAIRAAQLGLKVACIDKEAKLGGTCLRVGCIPSKALLESSERYHEAAHGSLDEHGIKMSTVELDLGTMLARKDKIVDQLTSGVAGLFKKNGVTAFHGLGKLAGNGKVTVELEGGGTETLTAKNILIATGSEPTTIPGVELDYDRVGNSTTALSYPTVPEHLVVIGGGVIGLELGSVFARLGTEVKVIEFLDAITPGMDGEVQRQFQKILMKQGIEFTMGAAVQSVDATKTKAKVTYKLRKDESEHVIDADVVLVATGRKPFTVGLGLDALGVEMTKRGQIAVDAHWQTSVPGIYAIGDVIEGPMLAHKAEDEGMAVADTVAGLHGHVNYGVIPGVIYTHPEVANVGATEEALKDAGRSYKVGKFSFMGNGRAKANFAADGFVKIIADAETDRILGAHIIGPAAGDLIHEVCVAMEFGASAEDLALTCHAHPTYSEAVREAALACGLGAIHA